MVSHQKDKATAVDRRDGLAEAGERLSLNDADFQQALLGVVPELRAFAHSLARNADAAHDLVQDTMVRAWGARKRFQANTNMRAWTFSILRNRHRSLWARSNRMVEWGPDAETRLAIPAHQESPLDLADLHRAMQQLPIHQREALVLIGAGGLSHEEAAEICGCAVGTIKSRVSRARQALADMLGDPASALPDATCPAGDVTQQILRSLSEIESRNQ